MRSSIVTPASPSAARLPVQASNGHYSYDDLLLLALLSPSTHGSSLTQMEIVVLSVAEEP